MEQKDEGSKASNGLLKDVKVEPTKENQVQNDPLIDEVSLPSNNYMIMGYNVIFPQGKKPFPAQLAVMNKVLLALKSNQHALLESPTGSGKTLALLCSSLTFQRQHFKELQQQQQQQAQAVATAKAQAHVVASSTNTSTGPPVKTRKLNDEAAADTEVESIDDNNDQEEEDDDFDASQPSFDKFRYKFSNSFLNTKATDKDEKDENKEGWISMENKKLKAFATTSGENSHRKRRLPGSFQQVLGPVGSDNNNPTSSLPLSPMNSTMPKIFFCSRTHSQLAQVIEELKHCPMEYLVLDNNEYPSNGGGQQLKSSVLGSKANYCVNPRVNKDVTQIDEKCRIALEERNGCSYFKKRKSINTLKKVTPSVWDIEEMVSLAKKHRECAFFHARDLLIDANIVFCPYNYLLDPVVRDAVGINLKNAIVILDEAHNVEDTCRSSASLEMSSDLLTACIKAFTFVLQSGTRPTTPYSAMCKLLNGLTRWLKWVCTNSEKQLKPTGYEEESGIWTGSDTLAILSEYCGIDTQNFQLVKNQLKEVIEFEKELTSNPTSMDPLTTTTTTTTSTSKENTKEGSELRLSSMAIKSVQQIIQVMEYMLRDDKKFLDDFKLIARKTRRRPTSGSGRQEEDMNHSSNPWEYKICIWCLNAAVAFQDVVKQAKSIILTSGTLSPMDSFAGELGCDFPIRLEANHVVNIRQQVLIGSVLCTENHHIDLSASYKNQQDFGYQDAMGHLLEQYASVIPGGILMFFPSYALMLKLVQRWKLTKKWHSINSVKQIFIEPRHTGKEFDLLLEQYKETIACDSKKGAIMLAVYRGKVSEGIDFSNDNARAVLAVGIPYPNVKELQVQLKRQYQDTKCQVDRKLVNGAVWYQLQAFRALNQALGRCIRHREDYGVILLIDSRHRQGAHVRHMSKWIRPHVQEFTQSNRSVQAVQHFFQRIEKTPLAKRNPPLEAAKTIELKYETNNTKSIINTTTSSSNNTSKKTMASTLQTVKSYMAATVATKAKTTTTKSHYFSIFQKR